MEQMQMRGWLSPLSTALSTRLSSRWVRLPLLGRLCLIFWILAALFGLYRVTAHSLLRITTAAGTSQSVQRARAWGTIYDFALSCAPALKPGANLTLVDPVDGATRRLLGLFDPTHPNDENNWAAVAYALYPDRVAAIGDVSAAMHPIGPATDYVAVWEQAQYRAPGAQAAARAVESSLRQQLPGSQVCNYGDATHDRGVIFAVSPRARAELGARAVPSATLALAARTTAATPSLAELDAGSYALTLLGLISLWLIGLLGMLVLTGGRLTALLIVAAALPLGCLGAGIELLAYSFLGVPWAPGWLALPWVGLAGLALWRFRAKLNHQLLGRARRALAAASRPHLAADERIAGGMLLALALAVIVVAPFSLPRWDGFNYYYFKALMFFHDGSVVPYLRRAGDMYFTMPAHPPLVSLNVSWLYLWIGHSNEHTTLLLWPALLISLLVAFFAFARTVVSRRIALWGTLGLALTSYALIDSSLGDGFADLPLALFLLLGVGLLWHWRTSPNASSQVLLVAGLMLGGAALTKEEGLTAAIVALCATPLLTFLPSRFPTRMREWWLPLGWSGFMLAAAAAPWLVIRSQYPIPELMVGHVYEGALPIARALVATTVGFAAYIFARWLAALATISAWAIHRVHRHKPILSLANGPLGFLSTMVVIQLGIDLAGMAVAPTPVQDELSGTATRLLMQLAPLLFLAVLYGWPELIGGGSREEVGEPSWPSIARRRVGAARLSSAEPRARDDVNIHP